MRDALLLALIFAALLVAMRYPFAGVLAWAWFALLTPHQMAFGVYGLSLNVIIAAGTLLAVVLHGEWRRFRFDAMTVLLLLLAAWLSVSQQFSLDPAGSAVYYDRFIKLLVFVVLAVQMTTDRLRFHALLWMLVLTMGFFAAKGALFTLTTLGQFRVQGFENTILEDNNHMGIALATILPMILYLRQQAANGLARLGLSALFVMTIISILGTQSRGAFVCLMVFAGFFWLRAKQKFLILAALVAVLIPAIAFMPATWGERMESITAASEDESFIGRVDAWIINAKLAAAHPVTGVGLRNSYQEKIAATVDPMRAPRARAAHSIYFELLGGAGFIGLLLYVAILASAFFSALAWRLKGAATSAWKARFGYFAQMSLVVFGVGGAAVSLEMWDGYLLIVALIAALPRIADVAPATAGESGASPLRWRVKARGAARRPQGAPLAR